jgi:hypothetical protein
MAKPETHLIFALPSPSCNRGMARFCSYTNFRLSRRRAIPVGLATVPRFSDMLGLTRSDPESDGKHQYIGRGPTGWFSSISVSAHVAPLPVLLEYEWHIDFAVCLASNRRSFQESRRLLQILLSDYSGAVRQSPGAGAPEKSPCRISLRWGFLPSASTGQGRAHYHRSSAALGLSKKAMYGCCIEDRNASICRELRVGVWSMC